jgi:transcriptional regulator
MGRRGPKSEIEKQGLGDRVLALKLAGNSYQDIADTLGLDKGQIQSYLSKVKQPNGKTANNSIQTTTARELLTNQIRLEISQETALSELSKQLQDYTDEYNRAPDDKAKYAWSQNRIRILQEMNKVTGLYEPRQCNAPAPPAARAITPDLYTTDELREILDFEEKNPIRADKD